jgi:hypothetical protein
VGNSFSVFKYLHYRSLGFPRILLPFALAFGQTLRTLISTLSITLALFFLLLYVLIPCCFFSVSSCLACRILLLVDCKLVKFGGYPLGIGFAFRILGHCIVLASPYRYFLSCK